MGDTCDEDIFGSKSVGGGTENDDVEARAILVEVCLAVLFDLGSNYRHEALFVRAAATKTQLLPQPRFLVDTLVKIGAI